ncbi:NADH dehydrogenase [ubiquinone] 1 beta subcomplex subunit 10-like [Mytilus edulis]|uniref:NADH dehydrogenase [ubiquinone] 1 beta subcomplex subunit 10 n=1 Tax=Mytilus edulis TaxID=6550 RepID=A0A8S3SAQ3_MYTED|nr:NDUFB10 [Mytilus edulis]
MANNEERSPKGVDRGLVAMYKILDGPTSWVKETFVQPFQKKYPYYHRRFNRVPTIDQCDVNETACIYEAQEQWKRDKMVDSKIVRILKDRYIDCNYYEGEDAPVKCASIAAVSEEAATNWFIKYGDLGYNSTVVEAYMKQKHRMIWERRKSPEAV